MSNLVTAKKFTDNTIVSRTSEGEALSFIYDESWDLSGSESKAVGKSAVVGFSKVDKQYRMGIQDSLFSVYEFLKERDTFAPTASQLNRWRRGLEKIAKCLSGCNWNSLNDDIVHRRFKRKVTSCDFNDISIREMLTAFNVLYHANLIDRRFSGDELLALSKGHVTKQSIAIPIDLYSEIIANAIDVVEKYHIHRHKISKLLSQVIQISDDVKSQRVSSNSSLTKEQNDKAIDHQIRKKLKKIDHQIPDFNITLNGSELGKIQSACLVVTLAFTGARIGEVLSFNPSRYSTKKISKDKEISIVSGETSKGEDGIPRVVTWQTHPIVKDALELAFDMTESLREYYKELIDERFGNGTFKGHEHAKALIELQSAFITLRHKAKSGTSFVQANSQRLLTQYVASLNLKASNEDIEEFNRLNPSRDGDIALGDGLPRLTPHDFRRSFAVFFKRYGFGSSTTIKFQYKHQNINMSDYYANNAALQAMEELLLDADLLELLEEEGVQMGVDAFDEIYNESAQLSGGGGERIVMDKFQRVKNGHQVYMSRSEIEELVRNKTLSIVKLPTGGYCLNPSCSRLCGIGQFAAEKKPCEFQVNTDKSVKELKRQNKRLIQTFRAMNEGDSMMQSILVGIKQKIKINEALMEKHNIEFSEFKDKVKGVIATTGVAHNG
jgi:integrase